MWNVIRYEQVASTNEVCRQLAVRGADDTAVTARDINCNQCGI